MTGMASVTTPDRLSQILAELGDRVEVSELYDGAGSDLYHRIAAADGHEVREIASAVRPRQGRVLDLAAGSGRLTFPLLALGRHVTALDNSQAMVDILERRLLDAPAAVRSRCVVVTDDMTTFSLEGTFDTVILGTTSISLLTDEGRERLYSRVREHLAPGGLWLLSTVYLDASASGDVEEVQSATTPAGERIRTFEHVEADRRARVVTIVFEPPTGRATVCTTRIRLLSPDLLTAELGAAGFVVHAREELEPVSSRLRSELWRVAVSR